MRDDLDACALYCLNENNAFIKLSPSVKDGTPCKGATNNLCISGSCRVKFSIKSLRKCSNCLIDLFRFTRNRRLHTSDNFFYALSANTSTHPVYSRSQEFYFLQIVSPACTMFEKYRKFYFSRIFFFFRKLDAIGRLILMQWRTSVAFVKVMVRSVVPWRENILKQC